VQRESSRIERTDRAFLRLAVERGYLDPGVAKSLLSEAASSGQSAERLAVVRGHLSTRRLRRLQTHLRFRSLRRSDKEYARLVLELGWVERDVLRAGLRSQRERFAENRERVRLGTLLVEQGALSAAQDRTLCAQRCEEHDSQMGRTQSALGSSRLTRTFSAHGPSVQQLEEAVHKVEWLRKLSEQMGVSDHPGEAVRDWTRDSAAAVEAICLARAEARRAGHDPDAADELTRAAAVDDTAPLDPQEETAEDPALSEEPERIRTRRLRRWFGLAG